MNKRTILHIILWIATVVFFGLAYTSHSHWVAQGGNETDPARHNWIIYGVLGVACIAVWFFTREKEEEISITRG